MAFLELPPRSNFVSASVDSKVFIWGGALTDDEDTTHLQYLYSFDTLKEKWSFTSISGPRPAGYLDCGSTQSGNVVYIYGGEDEHNHCTGSLFSLDLELLSWEELSPHVHNGPMKKAGCGVAIHQESIIVFGGVDEDYTYTNELHVFKLLTGKC